MSGEYKIQYTFPLALPLNFKRTEHKHVCKNKLSWKEAEVIIEKVCREQKIDAPVINSNMVDFKLAHPCSAVMVILTIKGREVTFICDYYERATANLVHIAKVIQLTYQLGKMKDKIVHSVRDLNLATEVARTM